MVEDRDFGELLEELIDKDLDEELILDNLREEYGEDTELFLVAYIRVKRKKEK